MDVDQQRLYDTTDAVVWAEEFAKVCPEVDQMLMVTWFANAIETGRSAGRFQFMEHMRAAVDAVFFGHFPPEVEPDQFDGQVPGEGGERLSAEGVLKRVTAPSPPGDHSDGSEGGR